jgi:hypothetical protein
VFTVNGEELNIFQLLRRANYQGAAIQFEESEQYGFRQWSLLSRGTQRRMLEASDKYIQEIQSQQPSHSEHRQSEDQQNESTVAEDFLGVANSENGTLLGNIGSVSIDSNNICVELNQPPPFPDEDVSGCGGAGSNVSPPLGSLSLPTGTDSEQFDPSHFTELGDEDLVVINASCQLSSAVIGQHDSCNDDVDGSDVLKKRKLKFSEAFLDFVCRQNIAKAPAMEWINDMRRENVDFDVEDMPRTWKTLTKPTTDDELEFLVRPIHVFSHGGKQAKLVHFGLIRTLRKHLPYIINATFPNPATRPKVPHLRLELWTDGVELCNYGSENDLWPVALTVVSIGSQHDGEHVYVPPWARKVLMLSLYLGSHKPSQPAPVFREIVDELKLLDPRERGPDRPFHLGNHNVREEFTASLIRFVADHPARCFVKNIKGCQSHGMCEKCTNNGERVHHVSGMVIWQVTELELRTDELFLTYPNHTKKVC